MTDLEKAARMALEALETYKGFIDDAHILEGQWHWIDGLDNVQAAIREALTEQPAQHDYRTKYDRPCYKCRSNFCPGNCKEPEHLQQPAQQLVDWEAVAADQAMTIAMMKAEQEDAVLAEREACAKVCDEAAHDWHQHAKGGPVAVYNACAAAIRARGQA